MTNHGFVDESIRPGWYRLTMVSVPTPDLAAVTRTVRAPIPRGQVRVHLSSEGAKRRRTILRAWAGLDVAAIVFETPYDGRGDDQVARDRCLRALARAVEEGAVGVLVFDTRGPDRDKRDRHTLRKALLEREQHHVVYSHRGSRDELLLALPDAIGWAAGAGTPWLTIVSGILTIKHVAQES